MMLGARQAIADINAAGGLNGEMLNLLIEDDSCDPKQAIAAAEQLVNKGAVLVVGHYCNQASISASSVYSEAGVLLISPAATAPEFTDSRPSGLVFRIGPRGDKQALAVADVIKASSNSRQGTSDSGGVVIVTNGSSIDDANASILKAKLSVAPLEFRLDDRGFAPGLQSTQNQHPSFVYLTDVGALASPFVQQYLQDGAASNVTLIIGSNDPSPNLSAYPVNYFPKSTVLIAPPRLVDNPANAKLVQKFESKGAKISEDALCTYAAFQVWFEAAGEIKSTVASDVAAKMAKGKFYPPLGEVVFDDHGDLDSQPGYVAYSWVSPEAGFKGGQ
ncbi:branched-chain amino acid ABC transporter substrate-binding protein [Neorhizobium galegae]|nr:branched-chain amino acid ABC transporter substrate-binding protein [Neorhizobium galegae]